MRAGSTFYFFTRAHFRGPSRISAGPRVFPRVKSRGGICAGKNLTAEHACGFRGLFFYTGKSVSINVVHLCIYQAEIRGQIRGQIRPEIRAETCVTFTNLLRPPMVLSRKDSRCRLWWFHVRTLAGWDTRLPRDHNSIIGFPRVTGLDW